MTSITPILLAGGSGTRLWPSSRKSYPKQFMQLTAGETLFQQSAQRVLDSDILKSFLCINTPYENINESTKL